VALSEHELKLLAEMEAALAADDPRLVGTLTGKARTRQASRVLLGFFSVLAGLTVVVAGLIAKSTPVGIIGFVIALAGAFTAISNFSLRQMVGSGAMGSPAGKRHRPGWGDRLERRWDDRNNN
jgi:hypothetical protein